MCGVTVCVRVLLTVRTPPLYVVGTATTACYHLLWVMVWLFPVVVVIVCSGVAIRRSRCAWCAFPCALPDEFVSVAFIEVCEGAQVRFDAYRVPALASVGEERNEPPGDGFDAPLAGSLGASLARCWLVACGFLRCWWDTWYPRQVGHGPGDGVTGVDEYVAPFATVQVQVVRGGFGWVVRVVVSGAWVHVPAF